MTRPNNDHFFSRVGAVSFPVEGDQVTDEQLFSVLDPLRDRLLRFFRATINQELGQGIGTVEPTSVWAACRTSTKFADRLPVEDTLFVEPTPDMMTSSEFGFPLLAVFRRGSNDDEWSIDIERINSRWGINYIVGPLDPADQRRMGAAVHGAHMVILQALRAGRHPAYQGGAHQFPEAELWKLRIEGTDVGPATFGERDKGQIFHMLELRLVGEELVNFDTTVYPAREGVDLNVGIGSDDGILADVMQASSDVPLPPTLG
jgi:hypothetical protein